MDNWDWGKNSGWHKGLKDDLPNLSKYSEDEKRRYKDIPLYHWKKIVDCVKIDHYSWHEDSPFRYLDKKLLNKEFMKWVTIAVENEFLHWDSEYAKNAMIRGLGMVRNDEIIPPHAAWEDDSAFDDAAIEALKSLVRENESLEITDIVRKAEQNLQNANSKGDTRLAQIYERILYELNECSLKEFYALKSVVADGK